MREQIIKDITEKVMIKLAKHEVELGLIDNYNDTVQKAIGVYVQADNKFKDIKNLAKSISDLFKNAGDTLIVANKMYLNIEKQAADLGIKLPNETINNHKSLSNYAKKIDEAVKVLNAIK